MQGFKKVQKGEITVFLSLVLILILSLLTALLESASVQTAKNERQVALTLAMESVFAEYDKELWETYHIFAIDARYGGGFSYDHVINRLEYYGASHTDNRIREVRLLSDHNGMEFYRLAVLYELGKYGLSGTEEDQTEEWNSCSRQGDAYEKEETDIRDEIQTQLEEAEESLPKEDNPLGLFDEISGSGILAFLNTEENRLSEEALRTDTLYEKRSVREGNSSFSGEGKGGLAGKLLFQNYIMRHFSNYAKAKADRTLACEAEYLLVGKETDRENLEKVLNRILLLRLPGNYGYLIQCPAKVAEADALAASLCTLLTIPGITGLVKQGILLAWAYGESLVDLQTLLDGKKAPLIKDDTSWQLQLSALLSLGSSRIRDAQKESDSGMSYEDYLRALLLISEKEKLTVRCLNLVENDLRLPVDGCITQMRVEGTGTLRKGVKHVAEVEFHYQ